MKRNILWVWGLVFLAVLVYLAVLNSSLPEHIAVHFDINGKPNGFQDRSTFVSAFLIFVLVLNTVFLGMSFFIHLIPKAFINIPWKQYWFSSSELQVKAYERLKIVLGMSGIFINITLWVSEQMVYQANDPQAFLVIPVDLGLGSIFILSALLLGLVFLATKPSINK